VRRLDRDSLAARFPYPVAPVVLVALDDSAPPADSVPVRLAAPLLGEGPHQGYAMQWFAFAFIAIAGMLFAVRAERRGRPSARVR
jgi:surfeit locus 1 family protein